MEDNLALNCQNKEMIYNQTPTDAPFVNGRYRGRLAKDKPRITLCQLVSHLVNFKGFTRSSKYCYKADDGGRAGQKYHKDWTSDCTGDSHSKQKKNFHKSSSMTCAIPTPHMPWARAMKYYQNCLINKTCVVLQNFLSPLSHSLFFWGNFATPQLTAYTAGIILGATFRRKHVRTICAENFYNKV